MGIAAGLFGNKQDFPPQIVVRAEYEQGKGMAGYQPGQSEWCKLLIRGEFRVKWGRWLSPRERSPLRAGISLSQAWSCAQLGLRCFYLRLPALWKGSRGLSALPSLCKALSPWRGVPASCRATRRGVSRNLAFHSLGVFTVTPQAWLQ